MRKGVNSSKEALITSSNIQHRVLVPLYIPFEKDYYKDAFSIFEMCLNSILNTSIYKLKITVVSDGCCDKVNDKLYRLFRNNKINELIIEKDNIGKINAILKGLRTVNEPFVTITDADILFLNNWDKNIFEIFSTFKKAAVVSPIPVFRKQLSYTANIWLDFLFSKKMKFREVKNPDALEKFANSLGWPFLHDKYKDVIMTLKQDNVIAVVSAAHCVATYKTKYLKNIPRKNTIYKLGGNTEGEYLDKPPYELDGYRLSTYDNYAYHMGNLKEDWIVGTFDSQKKVDEKVTLPVFAKQSPKKKPLKLLAMKLLLKAFKIRKVYDFFLKSKGLTREKLKVFK
ncbi:glycosyltransferase family A protein [Litoribaculum gwangyangense]|uniref:Glycosyltransferase 2-like domain-containing protein n=1 Tax=Litoribaculum gwangyangense TaxID=1130722 RepID=A0ABP9CNZ4_9FLAO